MIHRPLAMVLVALASLPAGLGSFGTAPVHYLGAAPPAPAATTLGPPYSTLLSLPTSESNATFGCAGINITTSSNATRGTALVSSSSNSMWCSSVTDNQGGLLPVAGFALPINSSPSAFQVRVQFTVRYHWNWSIALGTCKVNSSSGECNTWAIFEEYAVVDLIELGRRASPAQSTVWSSPPNSGPIWDYKCSLGNCTTNSSALGLVGHAHGSSQVALFFRHQLNPSLSYELVIGVGAYLSSSVYSTGSFSGTSAGLSFTQSVALESITIG